MPGRVIGNYDFTIGDLEYTSNFVLSSWMPPKRLISAALAFVFEGERLLLASIKARSWESGGKVRTWDLPGGHLERGETPEPAMRREVLEETGAVVGSAALVAH